MGYSWHFGAVSRGLNDYGGGFFALRREARQEKDSQRETHA
jgi:hypothetical protein